MTVKFGILAPEYPPAAAALEAARRAEDMGWDFLDYPDQLVSTNPIGMLAHNPVPAADPSLPTCFFADQWLGSLEMCAAAAVVTEQIPLIVGVIDPLRRAPAVMAQSPHARPPLRRPHDVRDRDRRGEAVPPLRHPAQQADHAVHRGDRGVARAVGLRRDADHARIGLLPARQRRVPAAALRGPAAEPARRRRRPEDLRPGGRVCDGWLTYLPGGLADDYSLIAEAVGAVKQIAADNDRDPDSLRFNAMVNVCLAETDDRAWELVRHPVSAWISMAAAGINSGERGRGSATRTRSARTSCGHATWTRSSCPPPTFPPWPSRCPTRSPTASTCGAGRSAPPPGCRRSSTPASTRSA